MTFYFKEYEILYTNEIKVLRILMTCAILYLNSAYKTPISNENYYRNMSWMKSLKLASSQLKLIKLTGL